MSDKIFFEFLNSPEFDSDRSVIEQPGFHDRLFRACRDNPDLPPTFVANCLLSLLESRP
jgi:hypothetical protein